MVPQVCRLPALANAACVCRGATQSGPTTMDGTWPASSTCSDDSELLTGMRLARAAIGRGELVVMPTDTVYGVAADAFNPIAVQRLLDAKGRDAQSPPPVLIPGIPTLDALAESVPDEVRALVDGVLAGRAHRSSCRRNRRSAGTSATPTAPSHFGCRATASPSSCSRRRGRSPCRARTSPDSPPLPPPPRPRRCSVTRVAVYLDGGPGGRATRLRALGPRSWTRRACDLPDGKLRIVRHGVDRRECERDRRATSWGPTRCAYVFYVLVAGVAALRHASDLALLIWKLSTGTGCTRRSARATCTPDRRHGSVASRCSSVCWPRSRSPRSCRTFSLVFAEPLQGPRAARGCPDHRAASASPTTSGTSTG